MTRMQFELDVNDGFPPVASELIHVEIVGSNIARIDNTPFFVEGIAIDDVVYFEGEPDSGIVNFVDIKKISRNRSISVIFIEKSIEEEIYQEIRSMKLYIEFGSFPEYDMLAIGVPNDFEICNLRKYLDRFENLRLISYAELCINDEDR